MPQVREIFSSLAKTSKLTQLCSVLITVFSSTLANSAVAPLSSNSTIAAGSSLAFGLQADKGSDGLTAPNPIVTGSICR